MAKLTRADLEVIFKDGPQVYRNKVLIGRGRFESELQEEGFTKSELRRLVSEGLLERLTTMPDGKVWRATYVFDAGAEQSLDANAAG